MGGPNAIIKFLYFLYWAPTDPEGGTNLFYFYVHVLAVRQCVNGANKGCCQCASSFIRWWWWWEDAAAARVSLSILLRTSRKCLPLWRCGRRGPRLRHTDEAIMMEMHALALHYYSFSSQSYADPTPSCLFFSFFFFFFSSHSEKTPIPYHAIASLTTTPSRLARLVA